MDRFPTGQSIAEAAQLLIQQHGLDAEEEAEQQKGAAERRGDRAAKAEWDGILLALRRLRGDSDQERPTAT